MSAARSIRARITKRTVDAEAIPAVGESRVWDTDLKGFCLRVYPKSRKSPEGRRVYAVKYRIGRTQRWFTIGEHGSPWTPDQSREVADNVLHDARKGIDHQVAKLELRAAATVAELIDKYLADGPATNEKKRASSWAQDKSSLERHVKPLIGGKVARELRPTDMAKLARDISTGATAADVKTEKKRGRARITGGPVVAARTLATVSAMLNWAVKHAGLKVEGNPVRGAVGDLAKRPAKERFLSMEESRRLFDTLAAMVEAKSLNAAHADAFRLLMLTGARRSEVAGLRWVEVDLVRNRLNLPPDRTKAGQSSGERRIVLSADARAILEKRRSNGEFVFPAHRGKGHVVGLQKSWEKVRAAAKLPGLRLHDLRHSFASFAIADGASLFLVSKALGHSNTRVTERYSHLQGDALDDLAERVGKRMGAKAAGHPTERDE